MLEGTSFTFKFPRQTIELEAYDCKKKKRKIKETTNILLNISVKDLKTFNVS